MSEEEYQQVVGLLNFYKNESKHIHLVSGWGLHLRLGIQAICGGDKKRVPDILRQLVDEGYLRENCGDYFFK